MTFGERLTQLREENGYSTRNEFAKKLGIPGTTLRNYETDAREPGHTFLKQISEFFDVSVDYLLGLSDDKEKKHNLSMTASEIKHVKKYRSLDLVGQEHVNTILQWEFDRIQQINNDRTYTPTVKNTRFIRYYHRLASAGTGEVIFDDLVIDRIEIPDIPEYRRVAYAISVNGYSMEPLYSDGDILLIEPSCAINVGEIGIFNVDGKAYVKKLGVGELISLNEEYNNIPITRESMCMGRVVDKYSVK